MTFLSIDCIFLFIILQNHSIPQRLELLSKKLFITYYQAYSRSFEVKNSGQGENMPNQNIKVLKMTIDQRY